MTTPGFKVEVTHGATTNTYINDQFPTLQVTRRENGFSTSVLLANNYQSQLYPNKVDRFDTVKVHLREKHTDAWTQVFQGLIYSVDPVLSMDGELLKINCRGLGYALESTHCNTDYGAESNNATKDTPKEIWDDLVTNYVNKSFAGSNTGYALTNTYIANIASALSITFLNSPYQMNSDIINRVCQIVCAYEDGSAGPHWFVDPSGNLLVNTIGAHENPAQWPDWWNTDQAGSTLEQGKDFVRYSIPKKTEQFANKIVFLTDFRKPGYDYWTNNNSGLWGTADSITISDEATIKIVGTHSLKMESSYAVLGKAYYPSAQNAGWDVTDWGSEKTIPRIAFYFRRNGVGNSQLRLFTTNYNTDYFVITGWDSLAPDADKFYHISFPIGPYYLTSEESTAYKWTEDGSPDWTDINGFCFALTGTGVANGINYIDDLHFGQGKIIREAYNSTNITANKEHQIILMSRTALDDSGIATDDTGMAARYAYAELLRRQKDVQTIQFTVTLKPAMLPGQKLHAHAAKSSSGSFNIDKNFRILSLTHNVSTQGFLTTVTATDDLTNSFPLTVMDQRQLITEYTLINNREVLDLKGGDVDLLIPRLQKDYPS